MAAYSFKGEVIPYILDGTKTHTIRGKRRNPDKPGATFYGYYAMRAKHCRKLIEAPVLRVQDIRMERARLWIDGEELGRAEKNLPGARRSPAHGSHGGGLCLTELFAKG
jgi:hypothetical protein